MLTDEPRFRSYQTESYKTGPANVFEVVILGARRSLSVDPEDFALQLDQVQHEDIADAVAFKRAREKTYPKAKKVPMADALGIAMARRRAMTFVTSDAEHFSGEADVELVGP